MIRITRLADINWINLYRIVYQHEAVELDAELLRRVDASRAHFDELIARGVPCYGMTTGLGKLVELDPDASAARQIAANTLRERATAHGQPMPAAAARDAGVAPGQFPVGTRRRQRGAVRLPGGPAE